MHRNIAPRGILLDSLARARASIGFLDEFEFPLRWSIAPGVSVTAATPLSRGSLCPSSRKDTRGSPRAVLSGDAGEACWRNVVRGTAVRFKIYALVVPVL